VIEDGVTGFIRETEDELVDVLGRIPNWTEPDVERRPSAGSHQRPWPTPTSGCTRESWRTTCQKQHERGYHEPMIYEPELDGNRGSHRGAGPHCVKLSYANTLIRRACLSKSKSDHQY
jgi:hypothetical protein